MAAKSAIAKKAQQVPGFAVSESPTVYLAAIPGFWLVEHSTPSWRSKDPKKGFQRIVKEQRAKEIARLVIEGGRTFPNAITLATSRKSFVHSDGKFELPAATKFLVVDGQHRLFAQNFSNIEAQYPCVIHMGCTEQQMAFLFLEINDNQRRVPSSLRWDLVRLVRSDDQSTQMTADIVFELVNRPESPFNVVGIDLTGENKDITIKQGSLAPEIRSLISRTLKRSEGEFDDYLDLLIRFFTAIRSIDPDGWGDPKSPFFRARVLRALLRVLTDLLLKHSFAYLTTNRLREYLSKIDPSTLSEERLRAAQGSAGVLDLYKAMSQQVGVGQPT
jgi:DGQHR domain-containing protein